MSNRRKPKNLREALARKQVRESHYDIPLVTSDVADEAMRRVTEARNLVRAARMVSQQSQDDPEVQEAVASADKELAAAERAYEGCFYRVRFRGLSEPDRNALENAHLADVPDDASDEEKARLEEQSTEAWIYALMEACCLDSDMTADDWRDELASERWTSADVAAIKRAVVDPNMHEFSAAIPKG